MTSTEGGVPVAGITKRIVSVGTHLHRTTKKLISIPKIISFFTYYICLNIRFPLSSGFYLFQSNPGIFQESVHFFARWVLSRREAICDDS